MNSLVDWLRDVARAAVAFEASSRSRRWENRTMADCKATREGIGADPHTCQCLKGEHLADGSTPSAWHECACRARWTDEQLLESGPDEGRTGQVIRMPSDALERAAPSGRRLHDGPAYDPPSREIPSQRGRTYVVHENRGPYEVLDVTDVVYAPTHVVFVRDGELVLARLADMILKIEPK